MKKIRLILVDDHKLVLHSIAQSLGREKVYIMGMLNAGAYGYILKSGTYKELLTALKTVFSGKVYLSREIAHLVADQAMTVFIALASSHALNVENNRCLYLLHQMLINANLIKE